MDAMFVPLAPGAMHPTITIFSRFSSSPGRSGTSSRRNWLHAAQNYCFLPIYRTRSTGLTGTPGTCFARGLASFAAWIRSLIWQTPAGLEHGGCPTQADFA